MAFDGGASANEISDGIAASPQRISELFSTSSRYRSERVTRHRAKRLSGLHISVRQRRPELLAKLFLASDKAFDDDSIGKVPRLPARRYQGFSRS